MRQPTDRLGGAPLTQLADVLVMDRTTLTRNLKPLVRRGLIRIEHEADQRIRNVNLTKSGRRVFEEARPQWEQAQSRIVERLWRRGGPISWAILRQRLPWSGIGSALFLNGNVHMHINNKGYDHER